jgi:hypothetical protein
VFNHDEPEFDRNVKITLPCFKQYYDNQNFLNLPVGGLAMYCVSLKFSVLLSRVSLSQQQREKKHKKRKDTYTPSPTNTHVLSMMMNDVWWTFGCWL